MKRNEKSPKGIVKNELFPPSLFGIYCGTLFVMIGLHTSLGVINLPNGKIYEVNNGVIIKEKKS